MKLYCIVMASIVMRSVGKLRNVVIVQKCMNALQQVIARHVSHCSVLLRHVLCTHGFIVRDVKGVNVCLVLHTL